MQDLKDKVAFITGGGSGLGFALAQVFGEAGVRVAIADLRSDRVDAAVGKLQRLGIKVMGVTLDVTDRAAYQAAADRVEARLGSVQLLFNNAGVGVMGCLAGASYQDWDWILGVNLGGVVNGLCTFAPRIRSNGKGGHIVSTASAAGLFASVNMGIYVASKMAVVGAMEVLRAELAAESIGVSVICPHLMRTNIHDHEGQRPERFRKVRSLASMAPSGADSAAIEAMTKVGMDPLDVARETLAAVRENRLYVIPFPELRGIVRSRYEALDAAIPHTEPDAERLEAEAPTLVFQPYVEALGQTKRG